MSILMSRAGVTIAASVMSVLLVVGMQPAEARDGARDGKAQRPAATAQRDARPQQRPHAPRGDFTRHTQRQRTENGRTSRTEWTNDEGRTATRDAAVERDREARTRTRDVTYTGPEGRTRTVNDVTQRTDDGYLRSTTVTGPNGNTGTRDVTVSCDKAAGNCTKDVAVDRPNE